jgi:peptidoglycan/LPS O-acetylase OafA/YrhL
VKDQRLPEPLIPLSRRNLVSLDGLRGLAIIAVMCTHSVSRSLLPAIRYVFDLGWSGVDLFFVLSGFLITGILLDTREATNCYKSFYCRRVLRIFPLYYSFLLVAFLVFPFHCCPVKYFANSSKPLLINGLGGIPPKNDLN